MMDTSPPPSERRKGARYLACFAASILPPDGHERPSLIRDLSVSGVLLLVQTSSLQVGDSVKLQLYIAEDPSVYRSATGRVVRVEKLSPQESDLWRRRAAIQFDEELTMYEADIKAFNERAKMFGWSK